MYVYIAKIDNVVRYIGVGSKDRYKHVNSGVSGCYELNKAHFNKEEISVSIFKDNLTREESLSIERDLLNKHKETVFNIVISPPDMEYKSLDEMKKDFNQLPTNTVMYKEKLKELFKETFIISRFNGGDGELKRLTQGMYYKNPIDTLDVIATLNFNDITGNVYEGVVRYYDRNGKHRRLMQVLNNNGIVTSNTALLWECEDYIKDCLLQRFIENVFISKKGGYKNTVTTNFITREMILSNIETFNNIKPLEIRTLCTFIIDKLFNIDIRNLGVNLTQGKRSIPVKGCFNKKFNITIPDKLFLN